MNSFKDNIYLCPAQSGVYWLFCKEEYWETELERHFPTSKTTNPKTKLVNGDPYVYLYVGESNNLRRRILSNHAIEPDNFSTVRRQIAEKVFNNQATIQDMDSVFQNFYYEFEKMGEKDRKKKEKDERTKNNFPLNQK